MVIVTQWSQCVTELEKLHNTAVKSRLSCQGIYHNGINRRGIYLKKKKNQGGGSRRRRKRRCRRSRLANWLTGLTAVTTTAAVVTGATLEQGTEASVPTPRATGADYYTPVAVSSPFFFFFFKSCAPVFIDPPGRI